MQRSFTPIATIGCEMSEPVDRRQAIRITVIDLAANFLFYDRRDDECLSQGEIQEAIKAGEITIEEIGELFTNEIRTHIPSY